MSITKEKMIATLKRGKVRTWNRYVKMADLRRADLRRAYLRRADLLHADLSGADLRHADLSGADLRRADLHRADLLHADLSGADLRRADLSGADLSHAYLLHADLNEADLSGTDLNGADLRGANLNGADLSGAKGLLSASKWLNDNFEYDKGLIVYRSETGYKNNPVSWVFSPGESLEEVPNPDRCTDCGCGVSFATLEWVRRNHAGDTIWKCRIEPKYWPGIIVPVNTNGKARCEHLTLLEVVR